MNAKLPLATVENFHDVVMHAGEPVVVLFGTPTCPPCKFIEGELLRIGAKAFKVDLYQDGDIAVHFNINTAPTLLRFDGHEVTNEHKGAMSKTDVAKFVRGK